jgi:hypothetical protein
MEILVNKSELKTETESENSAWVLYSQYKRSCDSGNFIYAFVEGVTDEKYYSFQIHNITNIDVINIKQLICGGKKQVLNVYNKVSKLGDRTGRELFFVDKDYSVNSYGDDNVCTTEMHSVENYYTTNTAFSNILCVALGIDSSSEEYNSRISEYTNSHNEFMENTMYLNLAITTCVDNKFKTNFNSQPNLFLLLSITKEHCCKTDNCPVSIEDFINKYKISAMQVDKNINTISQEEITNEFKAACKLQESTFKNGLNEFTQGHMDMWFLVEYLKKIKQWYNAQDSIFKQNHGSWPFNSLTCDNATTVLNSYAECPKSLRNYIQNHTQKF